MRPVRYFIICRGLSFILLSFSHRHFLCSRLTLSDSSAVFDCVRHKRRNRLGVFDFTAEDLFLQFVERICLQINEFILIQMLSRGNQVFCHIDFNPLITERDRGPQSNQPFEMLAPIPGLLLQFAGRAGKSRLVFRVKRACRNLQRIAFQRIRY